MRRLIEVRACYDFLMANLEHSCYRIERRIISALVIVCN
jgi:hypothetical protein